MTRIPGSAVTALCISTPKLGACILAKDEYRTSRYNQLRNDVNLLKRYAENCKALNDAAGIRLRRGRGGRSGRGHGPRYG